MSNVPGLVPGNYPALLSAKQQQVLSLFASLQLPEPVVYPSIPEGFRQRAEFRWYRHPDGRFGYAMHEPGSRSTLVPVSSFPIAAPLIQELMPALLDAINHAAEPMRQELVDKLFYVEFLTATTGQAIIALVYHRALQQAWEIAARQLRHSLQALSPGLQVIGRSRGQKLCIDHDFIHESMVVNGRTFHYQQVEGSFTQPNAFINQHMLEWSSTVTAGSGGDLLELYCGNGNFTLPLSLNFNKVLATEVSKTSIASAQHNIDLNRIHNVQVIRLSSTETAEALDRTRPFRRLAHLDLDNYQFSTILVDPPRAGLDEATLRFVQRFNNICYISCNPETLAANLSVLTQTHTIKQFALFDQFPYTSHMECGTYLVRTLHTIAGNTQ